MTSTPLLSDTRSTQERAVVIREEYEHLRGFNMPRAEIARRLGITDASLRDILRRQDRRQEARP